MNSKDHSFVQQKKALKSRQKLVELFWYFTFRISNGEIIYCGSEKIPGTRLE